MYGPYVPDQLTAGSQPDWYIGWLEGALRMMPNIETTVAGHTISWNILFPAVVLPGIIFTLMALYPWIERWATPGDNGPHNLLDRPRNAATRTAIGAMSLTFYILLWIEGGNDIIASKFDISVNAMTWFMRAACIIGPPIAFIVTKRVCFGLQRRDRDKLLHGYESGVIKRLPSGEYYEQHQPIPYEERAVLEARVDVEPFTAPEVTDSNGVRRPGHAHHRVRAKISQWFYGDKIPKPSRAEIAEGTHHEAELTQERDTDIEATRAKVLAPTPSDEG
jgi:ubiquinol-cytochrome c reductase cytochrome b subunit